MQTPNAGEFSVLQRFLDHRTTTTANTSTAETLVTVRGDEKRVFGLLGGRGHSPKAYPQYPLSNQPSRSLSVSTTVGPRVEGESKTVSLKHGEF